jgi:hypothetical protein
MVDGAEGGGNQQSGKEAASCIPMLNDNRSS